MFLFSFLEMMVWICLLSHGWVGLNFGRDQGGSHFTQTGQTAPPQTPGRWYDYLRTSKTHLVVQRAVSGDKRGVWVGWGGGGGLGGGGCQGVGG